MLLWGAHSWLRGLRVYQYGSFFGKHHNHRMSGTVARALSWLQVSFVRTESLQHKLQSWRSLTSLTWAGRMHTHGLCVGEGQAAAGRARTGRWWRLCGFCLQLAAAGRSVSCSWRGMLAGTGWHIRVLLVKPNDLRVGGCFSSNWGNSSINQDPGWISGHTFFYIG